MESKADVKSIMARFQAGEVTSEASSTLPGRAKLALEPTRSSSPNIPSKRPVLETLSGINIPPKPALKPTEAPELNKTKTLVSKLSNANVNAGDKPSGNVQKMPQKPSVPKPPEAKATGPKPPLGCIPSDPKPAIHKPSPAVLNRPSWVKEDAGGGETGPTPPKVPLSQQKPTSSISKLRQQTETTTSNPSLPNAAPKPTSNFKGAQSVFSKEAGGLVHPNDGRKAPPAATGSAPCTKPPAGKKPSLKKLSPQVSSSNRDATTAGPKKNALVNIFALGPAPAKPNRPPAVNLEPFRRGVDASGDGPSTVSKPTIPAPLTSYPGNHSNHSTPSQPPQPQTLPNLPPRPLGTTIQQEDFYDDIEDLMSAPPPLPPATGHPSQKSKVKEKGDNHDDQDPDKQWRFAPPTTAATLWEAEKKEREKKEHDARKKFKLVGSLESIHQVKACQDCRSIKTDLALKQGEDLDIIRVQGNPEGKWLARNQDGSIGYVKIASVEIDFNSLKRCKVQQADEPEVYDDVAPDVSGMKGHGVVLPPLPGQDGEIYDDVVDPNLEVRVPPPCQFTTDGNADQPAAAFDEEVYDDVDSQVLPPPPPLSSLPGFKPTNKGAEMDQKKQKKMEKEEKEFRKKFKYEGEIRVLYQVTVIPTLTNKKWASKELAMKAGERLDVIAKAKDDRLICRGEEGKFGYVSSSNIIMDDSEIYDDIDCIYDND